MADIALLPIWIWRDESGRSVEWIETADPIENARIINEHPDAIRLCVDLDQRITNKYTDNFTRH